MNPLQAIAGVALLVLVFMDVAQTTLTVNGSGWLSRRLALIIWRPLRDIHRRYPSHRLLALAGPLVILALTLAWFALLWGGWSLVYASDDMSVVQGMSKQPADVSQLLYFVGFTIITLGIGDYVPQGDFWEVLTVVASLSGFFLLTMVITYIMSVLSAAVNARAFASQVSGLGQSAEQFLRAGWDGQSFRSLDLPLSELSWSVAAMGKRYLAYPVLQYYHARQASDSPVVGLLVLDEALTLLRFGVAEAARPSPAVLHSARAAVRSFIEAERGAFVEPLPYTPATPELQALRSQGIPTVNEAEYQAALQDLAERRRRLFGMLHNDGWK
jgi:hypothetical protein